jgi:hypothetical protein
MTNVPEQSVLEVPESFGEQAAYETLCRGFFAGAIVRVADGSRYPVCFYDPIRLGQDLEEEARVGRPYIAERNLIVLPEVTVEAMRAAVETLALQGYFDHAKPLT